MDSKRNNRLLVAGSRTFDEVDLVEATLRRAARQISNETIQFSYVDGLDMEEEWPFAPELQETMKPCVFVIGFEYGPGAQREARIVPGAGQVAFDLAEQGRVYSDHVATEVPWGWAPRPMYTWVGDVIAEQSPGQAILFSDGQDEWVQFAATKLREAGIPVSVVFSTKSRTRAHTVPQVESR